MEFESVVCKLIHLLYLYFFLILNTLVTLFLLHVLELDSSIKDNIRPLIRYFIDLAIEKFFGTGAYIPSSQIG
jgi:hypothetical protein